MKLAAALRISFEWGAMRRRRGKSPPCGGRAVDPEKPGVQALGAEPHQEPELPRPEEEPPPEPDERDTRGMMRW